MHGSLAAPLEGIDRKPQSDLGAQAIPAGAVDDVSGYAAGHPAGAGDVLSGIIGGLLAQGVEPLAAAVAGVYIHGRAGDIAAEETGVASLVAGDLMAAIPDALASIQDGQESDLESMIKPL